MRFRRPGQQKVLATGVLLPLVLIFCLLGACVGETNDVPDPSSVTIGADPRIELVAIVCRLAAYPEYSENWPLRYFGEIGKWFAPFASHPAVLMARQLLMDDGIGYNAPLSLVVHADPTTLQPLVPLDPLPEKLDRRWTPRTAAAFLAALADFSREADFPGFFDSHGYLYDEISERISGLVHGDRLVPWMEDFFGSPCKDERSVLVSFLTGFRHYGLSVRLPCGCLALSPVLGVSYWTHAEFRSISPLLSAIVIHEFSHAYVDELVDEVWDQLEPSMTALALDRQSSLPAVYAGVASLAYETVVRACDSWFTLETHGTDEYERMLALHESQGFDLVRGMVPLLARYADKRVLYPEFRAFMPEIVAYLTEQSGK
jgi:hypothetical protein